MYYSAVCPSPLGMLTLGSDGEHLIGLWLEGQKYFGGAVREVLEERDGLPVFDAARDWLARYFAGEKPMPSELPLCPIGGEFRQRVWSLLCQIPYGETTTYGALARALAAQMGRPSMSSQAVGGAVGHNPISIIIPCHRVVGSGGSLTGYAGGIAAKLRLLEHEGVGSPACPSPRGARRFEPWQLDSLGRRGPSSTAYFVSRIGRTAGMQKDRGRDRANVSVLICIPKIRNLAAFCPGCDQYRVRRRALSQWGSQNGDSAYLHIAQQACADPFRRQALSPADGAAQYALWTTSSKQKPPHASFACPMRCLSSAPRP